MVDSAIRFVSKFRLGGQLNSAIIGTFHFSLLREMTGAFLFPSEVSVVKYRPQGYGGQPVGPAERD